MEIGAVWARGAIGQGGIGRTCRYLNRLLPVFGIAFIAVFCRACGLPADAGQPAAEPPAVPAVWLSDPMAGVVLEPAAEDAR